MYICVCIYRRTTYRNWFSPSSHEAWRLNSGVRLGSRQLFPLSHLSGPVFNSHTTMWGRDYSSPADEAQPLKHWVTTSGNRPVKSRDTANLRESPGWKPGTFSRQNPALTLGLLCWYFLPLRMWSDRLMSRFNTRGLSVLIWQLRQTRKVRIYIYGHAVWWGQPGLNSRPVTLGRSCSF